MGLAERFKLLQFISLPRQLSFDDSDVLVYCLHPRRPKGWFLESMVFASLSLPAHSGLSQGAVAPRFLLTLGLVSFPLIRHPAERRPA